MTEGRRVRNAFDELVVDVDELTFGEKVDVLRALSGSLQAERRREMQWLGRVLRTWLDEGGDLVALLGLRPAPGSRVTAQALVRQAKHDVELLRLANEAGSVRAAAARVQDGPRSPAAFTRARKRRDLSRAA